MSGQLLLPQPPPGLLPDLQDPLMRGCIGLWPFSEGGGSTVRDRAGRRRHANWNGISTHWAAGKFGWAGHFNNHTDYILVGTVGMDFSGSAPFSGFAWVRTDGSGGGDSDYIVGTDEHTGWYLRMEDTGELRAKIDDGTNDAHQVSTETIDDGLWHFVGIVLTHTRLWTVLDGEIIVDISNGSVGDMFDSLSFGFVRGATQSEETWNGQLSTVSLYDRALPLAEIQQIYLRGARAGFHTRRLFPAAAGDVTVTPNVLSAASGLQGIPPDVNRTLELTH